MGAPVRSKGAIVAAVLLAGLTLLVFAMQQYRGPESAVRRFHQALASRDARMLASVTVEPLNHPQVFGLTQTVLRAMGANSDAPQLRTKMQGRLAYVEAIYPGNASTTFGIVFVVVRAEDGWRISAQGTAEVFGSLQPSR